MFCCSSCFSLTLKPFCSQFTCIIHFMCIVQPLLQELGKQNPQVMQLIQENQAEFMRLINEPLEGDEENEMSALLPFAAHVYYSANIVWYFFTSWTSNMLDQIADAADTIAVTPEENEAILRVSWWILTSFFFFRIQSWLVSAHLLLLAFSPPWLYSFIYTITFFIRSLKGWDLIGHLSLKCFSPATRTSSWLPTTSWITCTSSTTMTGSEGHHYEAE